MGVYRLMKTFLLRFFEILLPELHLDRKRTLKSDFEPPQIDFKQLSDLKQ